MTIKYCMKRKENFEIGKTSEDYCVDCVYYDNGECWASKLEVKYTENANIIELPTKFNVYETDFGSYITDRKDKPLKIFLRNGQEIDLQGLDVIIHDNGIEFI